VGRNVVEAIPWFLTPVYERAASPISQEVRFEPRRRWQTEDGSYARTRVKKPSRRTNAQAAWRGGYQMGPYALRSVQ
jgi:hypothetical protein